MNECFDPVAPSTPDRGNGRVVSLRARALRIITGAFIFVLFWLNYVWLPVTTVTPDLNLSWNGALVHFSATGLQYGKDVIFTYGPLGYLVLPAYTGELFTSRVVWEFASKTVFAAILTATVFRLPAVWRLPFFLFTLLFNWTPDALQFVVVTTLAAELFRTGGRHPALTVFASSVFGFCSLIKFTYFLLAILAVALVTFDYLLQKKRSPAFTLVFVFAATFLLTWKITGQHFDSLLPYFRSSLEICLGYKEAMGLAAKNSAVVILGVLTLVLTLGHYAQFFLAGPNRHRLCVLLFFIGVTFLSWNQGLVRADDHVIAFFVFCPVALMLTWNAMTASPRVRYIGYGITSTILAFCIMGIFIQNRSTMTDSLANARLRFYGAWAVLTNTPASKRDLDLKLAHARSAAALPRVKSEVRSATIDVFGYEQGIALLNEFNYQPRPIFQSYSAYTPALIDANTAFYRSARAPAYVLLKLSPIDHRCATLEDAPVLRQILADYTFLFEERGYLLWKKTRFSAQPIAFEGSSARHVRFGTKVVVPREKFVWLELDFRQSFLGAARAALYKPAEILIRTTDSTGRQKKRRLIPSMATRGFLINPAWQNTEDLKKAAEHENSPSVVSFSIELKKRDRRFFRDRIDLRFSSAPTLGAL